MKKDYLALAFRNLRKRGIRSWLTMLGVFIGIAAVVSLISLGSGLERAITGQFSTLSTDTLTISSSSSTGFSPPGSTAVRPLTEKDLQLVESVNGVRIAVPRLLRVARLEYNNALSFGFITSIPKTSQQTDEIYSAMNLNPSAGKLMRPEDNGKVVLGNDYLRNDFFGREIRVGSRLRIQGKDFEVIGFLERTSTFTINSVILMTESDMKDIFEIGDEIDLIIARVDDEKNMERVAEEISQKFRRDRRQKVGEEDFEVQTPIQQLGTVQSILSVINIVVSGIAAISLIVGGIGIANTMFTSVLERTKEIGVMKAIGAKNSDILSIFIFEAALLGIVGGVIGAFIGLTLAFGISAIANSALGETIITVSLSLPLLAGSVAFSLFIGVLSGIVPALQASRLNPVEALRK